MLQAGRHSGKIMLKVILETWGEKIKLKRVFPHCKTLNFDKKQKKM